MGKFVFVYKGGAEPSSEAEGAKEDGSPGRHAVHEAGRVTPPHFDAGPCARYGS